MNSKPLISIVFTCKGRPDLTELCLRRLTELIRGFDHELIVAYDSRNYDPSYIPRLTNIVNPKMVVYNDPDSSRFTVINRALEYCEGNYFMHLENDFYWQRQECLDEALAVLERDDDVDYVRLEHLPFGENVFTEYREIYSNKIGIMKADAPYQFTFNPHIRREKFPCGRFQEKDFTKQPEQHHNDNYKGVSACLFGENFRHLGIYDEGGHYKPWYAERFTLRRGERTIDRPLHEFDQFCSNYLYRQLFMRYLYEHQK